jgi:spermidine synthase
MKKFLSFLLSIIFTANIASAREYKENLYGNTWWQAFNVDDVLYEDKTDHQHLIIFENSMYGRVLALDGIIQITQRDAFIYGEMLSHLPILAHGNVKKVLIIGGGDGKTLFEVLKHKNVEKATLVDIDDTVVNLSKKYMPDLSNGAFEDPRAEIIIADGSLFTKETDEKFDIIILDTTDPIGPGEALFTKEFYSNCKKALKEDGILVTQNGVPFCQDEELINSYNRLSKEFENVTFYTAPIPTYVGGFMTFGFATNNKTATNVSKEELNKRFEASKIKGKTNYYNPEIHIASFALPEYIKNIFLKN